MFSHISKSAGVIFLFLAIILIAACHRYDDSNPPVSNFKDYKFEEPKISGNTFYADPLNGSPNGDGSSENPWRTLQEVIDSNLIAYFKHSENYNPESEWVPVNENAPVKGGDRIILRNGHHGYIHKSAFMFKEWLTIEAEKGHTPVFSQIKLDGAFKKIYLKNLTIIKEHFSGTGNYWETETLNRNDGSCLALRSNDFWGKGSYVKANGLVIRTAEDISSWTAQNWVDKSATGISLRSAEYIEIINCDIENVRHGITIEYFSDNSAIVNNKIKNYCGDGSRIISNDVFFAYNTITDCFKVDDNHDDAIQSYSRGADNSAGTGTIKNVVIRGNFIIGTTDFSNSLAGNPQGIGCFDGMFDNWTIENNVVVTDHYHGISFYGFTNSDIVNNTVIDQIADNPTSPWIRISPHKNGTSSANCRVANNIVFNAVSIEGNNISEGTNYVIGRDNYSLVYELFIDPDNFDFHLSNNNVTQTHIVNQGEVITRLVSSEIDKDNRARDGNPDLGAYEYQ